jgi:hypothetical protein
MHTTYEVALGPAAIRAIRDLPHQYRLMLAAALRDELDAGPNSVNAYKFDHGNAQYLATPLSFNAYVAVHRQLTDLELARLSRQAGREVAPRGFWVIEFCSAIPTLVTHWREQALPYLEISGAYLPAGSLHRG